MIKHSFCSCIHTMMSYQLFQELCLTNSWHMLMWRMILDEDDNDLFHLLNHHLSVLYNNNFFFVLDSMFIWALSQTKSFQDSSHPTRTIPLTCCYHHTHFNICQFCELYHHLKLPVSFTISPRGHLASREEAFIITITKQTATGRTSTSLTKVFTATMGTFISPESTRRQLKYLTLRQMGFYRAIAYSIGCICSFSLWRPLGTSQIDCNMANYCLIMSILLFSYIVKLMPGIGLLVIRRWLQGDQVQRLSIIQRALYSRYFKYHGIKVLIVVFLNGIFAYLYGPVSAKEIVLSLLNMLLLNGH